MGLLKQAGFGWVIPIAKVDFQETPLPVPLPIRWGEGGRKLLLAHVLNRREVVKKMSNV